MDRSRNTQIDAGLVQDRDAPRQDAGRLDRLTRLTQAIAGGGNDEVVVRALFEGLPALIGADLIGVAKSNPAQVWTWSQSQGHGSTNALRLRLLDRFGQPSDRRTSPQPVLRLVRHPHLSPVQASAVHKQSQDDRAVRIHEVGLTVGPSGSGVLHVERAFDRPFSEQDLQLLAAVAAVLALALGNAGTRRQIDEAALRDPLTGLVGRRALDRLLYRELTAGFRYGMPACLLLLDLDYFKTVNEQLGHDAGDDLLKKVAALLEEIVREVDSVGRSGGEEFAVVLPHTDLGQAQALAERIRAEIERREFKIEGGLVRITASLGVTSIPNAAIESVGQWIAVAGGALCEAKSRGRNCVITHASSPVVPARAALSLAA